MAEGVDRFDRKQRPFEGTHAVKRDGGGEKLEHGIRPEFVPGAAEGEKPVEHAAPRWGPEHQRKRHAEVLQPAGQSAVQQMMRTSPNINKDERPKMNHRQPIRIHRTLCRFRQKIIHHAENRRSEKKRDGVVPVPPLDERILHPTKDRITVQ